MEARILWISDICATQTFPAHLPYTNISSWSQELKSVLTFAVCVNSSYLFNGGICYIPDNILKLHNF
jgi:hypothetical protein